jgi:hypothetical protein
MLGLEDLHFSNMDVIFHLNSMPRVCGSFETTDSTAHYFQVRVWIHYKIVQTLHKEWFLRVCVWIGLHWFSWT